MPTEFVDGRGVLDQMGLENGVLRLSGWVASVGAGPLEGFRIRLGERQVTDCELTRMLPSPDVLAAFSFLDSGDKARFDLKIPIAPDDEPRIGNVLITVTPLFEGGRAGVGWHGVLDPQVPLPPPAYIERIGGFFLPVAFEFLDHQVYRAGLRPTDAVLDVGCGTGRMAYALTYYLAPTAAYEGFDVDRELIGWATRVLTPRFPNFRFRHVDLHNRMYNPRGTLKAVEFSFPYGAGSFDLVLLTSVFTHLMENEVRHYLGEIRRVLKPGGRCLCTAFLINKEAADGISSGRADQQLVHRIGRVFVANLGVPESAVGLPEPLVSEWIAEAGLSHQATYYGYWCGRAGVTYQDMLVLERSERGEMGVGREGNVVRTGEARRWSPRHLGEGLRRLLRSFGQACRDRRTM